MALGRGATEGTLQGVVGERVDAAGDARVAAGGADGGGAGGEGAPGRGSAGALRRRHPLRPAPAAHPQGAPPSPPAACACPGATVCSPSLPAHLPLCHCCVRLPGGDSCEAGGACSDGSQAQCRPLQVALGAGGEGAPGRGTPHDVALARIRQGAAQPAPQVPPPPSPPPPSRPPPCPSHRALQSTASAASFRPAPAPLTSEHIVASRQAFNACAYFASLNTSARFNVHPSSQLPKTCAEPAQQRAGGRQGAVPALLAQRRRGGRRPVACCGRAALRRSRRRRLPSDARQPRRPGATRGRRLDGSRRRRPPAPQPCLRP